MASDQLADATGVIPLIPLVALVGPTASGKTALALALAERLRDPIGCEVSPGASRQPYRLMHIAPAKPTPEERNRLPPHLLDVVWPDEAYPLPRYQADATAAIASVWAH